MITSAMSSAERVLEALNFREPDVLPVDIGGTRVSGIHRIAYAMYRSAMGLPAQDEEKLMVRYLQLPELHEDFRQAVGVDLESVNPDTARFETEEPISPGEQMYVDRLNCRWVMPQGGTYYDILEPPLAHAETEEDLRKFPWPDEKAPGLFAGFSEKLKAIQRVNERAVFLGRTMAGIFEMTGVLCGMEKSLIDMAVNTVFYEALLDRLLELKLAFYEEAVSRLRQAGVEFFVISESDDLGTQNSQIMSLDMYRRLIKPRHAQLFKFIKSISGGRAYIELHSCGSVQPFVPDFIDSGVDMINPVQVSARDMDDTKALKKTFGKSIVFHGGGVDSQRTLPYGTPDEVYDEVRRRVDDLAPGGGFIFTPVHSIQHDVPYENFHAMCRALDEYRTQTP